MSMMRLAEEMKAHIRERRLANHAEMDKGKSHDEYMKLVGRNQELDRLLTWVNETATRIFGSEDEI